MPFFTSIASDAGAPRPLGVVGGGVSCSACGWSGTLDPGAWGWVLAGEPRVVPSGEPILGETRVAEVECLHCAERFDDAMIGRAVAARAKQIECARCKAPMPLRSLEGHLPFPTRVSVVLGEGNPALRTGARVEHPCSNCGAALVIDGTTRAPTCTFCRTRTTLPVEVWQSLQSGLVHPFFLWMTPEAARMPVPFRAVPVTAAARATGGARGWIVGCAIGAALTLVAIVGAVLFFAAHTNTTASTSHPRGVASAGVACDGTDAACSPDKKSELRCIDGKLITSLTCKGPNGCRTTHGGDSITCDYTLADENDPCSVDDSACSVDKKKELRCDGTKFIVSSTCKGANGCTLSPSGQAYSLDCDDTIADVGDACQESQSACGSDKQSLLMCKEGKFQLLRQCRGNAGCVVKRNLGAKDSTLNCDFTRAQVSDRCNESDVTCSADGKATLSCKDGAFAISRRCPGSCNVVAGTPTCR